jgi:hypothetical protein
MRTGDAMKKARLLAPSLICCAVSLPWGLVCQRCKALFDWNGRLGCLAVTRRRLRFCKQLPGIASRDAAVTVDIWTAQRPSHDRGSNESSAHHGAELLAC